MYPLKVSTWDQGQPAQSVPADPCDCQYFFLLVNFFFHIKGSVFLIIQSVIPFLNKPLFLRFCSTSLLKMLRENRDNIGSLGKRRNSS